jgi:hypothetical protein
MSPLCRFAAVLAFLLLSSNSVLLAQIGAGQVSGTVTDPQGAVVIDATVRMVDQATNVVIETRTNQSGSFVFAGVKPGSFTLSVESQGFKTARVAAFDVSVNQTVTRDVVLALGSTSESVTVTAQGEMLQQTSAELGAVLERKAVTSLPLNGRNFTQLLTLMPGASPIQTAQSSSIGTGDGNATGIPGSSVAVHASMNGQFGRSIVYYVDGIINTDFRVQTYAQLPNIDLIDEFKVQSHNDKVEFGGVTGGVVNLVSKSGGNDIHGSVFEFVRNDVFDARNPFTDATRTTPPPYRQNQFGASATGPILRNRMFFSGGYDGWRYVRYGTTRSYTPTSAELSGDFSNSQIRRNIFNPLSTRLESGKYVRDPFANNQIPASMIQPMVKDFLTTYGVAPTPGYVDPVYNYFFTPRTKDVSDNWSVKIDHHFRQADNVFFRYSEMIQDNLGVAEKSTSTNHLTARSFGGGWVHVFRPNLVLDVRGGTSGREFDPAGYSVFGVGLQPMKDMGYADIDRFQGLTLSLQTPWSGVGVGGPPVRNNPTWNLGVHLSWLRGSHNFKSGFQWISLERLQINQGQTYYFYDEVTGDPQAPGSTGASLASALLGLPSRFEGTLPEIGKVGFSMATWSGYFQDEWRITPNLTLNAGVRFDYTTRPTRNQIGPMAGIDMSTGTWLIGEETMPPSCNQAKQAPCIPGNGLQDVPNGDKIKLADTAMFIPVPTWDNWGPRASIAWRATPETVVRAGYGLSWDALSAKTQFPQHNLEWRWPSTQGFSGVANVTGTAPKYIKDLQGQFPGVLPDPAGPWNATGWMNDPQRKDGYANQWNVEVQRQLSPSTMLAVAYVGSYNGRLDRTGLANIARTPGAGTPAEINARRPVPWMSGVFRYSTSTGSTYYNSLQVKAERRFSNGLQSMLSYTWSRSIGNTSGWFNAEEGSGGGCQNFWDLSTCRGVSGFDVPHFMAWYTVYELPFGRGQRWLAKGPASWVLGNWRLNWVLSARSGQVYDLNVNGDIANVEGASTVNYGRPNVVGDWRVAQPSESMYYNPAAFAIPKLEFGSLGRNAMRGEPVVNADISVFKAIPLHEHRELQLRFESFNTCNVMIWALPGRTIGTAGAGRITNVATTPRQLQLGVRFTF